MNILNRFNKYLSKLIKDKFSKKKLVYDIFLLINNKYIFYIL